MVTRSERLTGGVLGLLVGDALGVPFEFHPPGRIPPLGEIEMPPPAGFPRAHAVAPAGAWSDDGAHALCLLASLLDRGALDPEDLGRRLVAWRRDGEMAVGGVVFDIGAGTARALSAISSGTPALEAGPTDERANGNGSLMRVLPLALWHGGSDEELVRDARAQSRVTHGHLRSQLACALYCVWVRRTMDGRGDAWREAVRVVRDGVAGEPAAREELDGPLRVDDPPGGQGGGYVVDCLHSARACVEAGPYEAVVRAAVALGNDTDTTACVAGGVAGARDGVGAIPSRWREALAGREIWEPLVQRLLVRCSGADG